MHALAVLITALGMAMPGFAMATAMPAFAATTTPMPANAMSMPMGNMSMSNMMMMQHHSNISVDAIGDVQYTPDIARITLGVNGEAASASAATADISNRANAVIVALKSLGIAASDIRTSGFNLYFRQPSQGPAGTIKGAYVASESVNIKAPVGKVGAAIDAAVTAGANESYGLEYDSSQRDALYKQAVQRAVQQARDLAAAAASAAGVKLGTVMSITVPSFTAPGIVPLARTAMALAAPAPPPPIEPGTGKISATVSVTYSIAR